MSCSRNPPPRPLRIAIRVAGEGERRHLAQVLGLAARRGGALSCCLSGSGDADVVVVRRGEPDSNAFLDTAPRTGRPVALAYTSGSDDPHPWRLPCPARVDDVLRVTHAIRQYLHRHDEDPAGANAGGKPTSAAPQ